MIKINMLSKEQKSLAEAVLKFEKEHRSKSFAERNNLGRMKNCKVCSIRHRAGEVCEQKILVAAPMTIKGMLRSAGKLPKRIRRHPNKLGLQLIEKTRKIFYDDFPLLSNPEDQDACQKEAQESMQLAKTKALRTIKADRKSKSRRVRLQQKASRKANR